jgi:hypothetical protein
MSQLPRPNAISGREFEPHTLYFLALALAAISFIAVVTVLS